MISLPIQFWDTKNTLQLLPADENGRTVRCRTFNQCRFTGKSQSYPLPLVYSEGDLFLPTVEMFMSLGRGTVYEETMWFDGKLTPKTRTIDTPVFYFVYNTVNYYHFIYDTIPYLFTYFTLKKNIKNIKLLVNKKDLKPFVLDVLELFGITDEDLIDLDFGFLYHYVIIGSSLTHDRLSNCPPHKEALNLIQSLPSTPSNLKRIYISRRTWMHNNLSNIGTNYTERRKCVNEDEVVDLFSKKGFTEVFCENLTMKEKIGLFKNAEVIAGPIGGGMCNCLFSPSNTKVISLNSPGFFDVNKRFEFSMNHTKLHHFWDCEFVEEVKKSIDGEEALSISGGINSPWKVNLNTLETFLDDVLYG